MLRFAKGAKGGLWATQVAPGNENNFGLECTAKKPDWSGGRKILINSSSRRLEKSDE